MVVVVVAVTVPPGSTWWERGEIRPVLDWTGLVSLSAEEIDQIGRLCLCKTQTFARPGPGCITQNSNTRLPHITAEMLALISHLPALPACL